MSGSSPDDVLPPKTVAITGASGALGQALLRQWHRRGVRLLALCATDTPLAVQDEQGGLIPLEQIRWCAGEEESLRPRLQEVDVLVLNHGINLHGDRSADAVARSLEVNALSSWRLLELFAAVVQERASGDRKSVV